MMERLGPTSRRIGFGGEHLIGRLLLHRREVGGKQRALHRPGGKHGHPRTGKNVF